MKITAPFFVVMLGFLAGCEGEEISLAEICQHTPERCERIEVDAACRSLRSKSLVHAYYLSQRRTPERQLEQLETLSAYQSCAERQTMIEYMSAEQRFNYVEPTSDEDHQSRQRYRDTVNERIAKKKRIHHEVRQWLDEEVNIAQRIPSPVVLHWLWLHRGDERAGSALIARHQRGELKHIPSLYAVSQAYAKRTPEKMPPVLMEILARYPVEDYTPKSARGPKNTLLPPDTDDDNRYHFPIFRALVHWHYQQGEYEQAYVFAKLLKINRDRGVDIDMIKQRIRNTTPLDNRAERYHDALQRGQFNVS
jgi:hypothetical protein